MEDEKKVTLSGRPPVPGDHGGAPAPLKANGQHEDYWILSDAERAKGFVRPVRRTYIHDKCGVPTKMSDKLAETYARDPKFYGATFCCECGTHLAVSEFAWLDNPDQRVGS